MEKILHEKDSEAVKSLFGNFDENIKIIENRFSVSITSRNGLIKIAGEDHATDLALSAIETLLEIYKNEGNIDIQKVNYVCSAIFENSGDLIVKLSSNTVCVTASGKVIKAKTIGQAEYVESMVKNTVVFGIGPAGTGKTYLAVAAAVNELRNKSVKRIILTRPAIEAGEKLGFLPGDLQNKVDPYLRPLYDGMYEMLGAEGFLKNQEKGVIEVAPLAYMRGRTLDNAFIILDEAQNTTPEQMKMFLTRIGFGSRAVITGDVTQVDLPDGKKSGLKTAQKVLKNIEDIEFCMLTDKDVVRHPLVQKIIKAYERYDEQEQKRRNDRNIDGEQSERDRNNRRNK